MILLNSILFLSLAVGGVSDGMGLFREAHKAAAGARYEKALGDFEAALALDPDNLRFGSDYRQVVIQTKSYDRCIRFFEALVADHPEAGNAFLNFGFAYVDKIPDSGSITQVINANTALSHFTRSVELSPSWIGYYTRGNSYLFWPTIFNRTHLGVADLERALEIQKEQKKEGHYVRTYISLGDGYWKMDNLEKATETWREGLAEFLGNGDLKRRLAASPEELELLIANRYDANLRVDTNLKDLWQDDE